ncbi:10879_t:CDS:1, partial [Entrophospora sp. SA101]
AIDPKPDKNNIDFLYKSGFLSAFPSYNSNETFGVVSSKALMK